MNFLNMLLLLCYAASLTNGVNILVMMPWPWYSHTINFMPIIKGLAARGHNVTMVSPFPQKKSIPNFHDIVVPNLKKEFLEFDPATNFVKSHGLWFQLLGLWTIGIEWTKITLKKDFMKELIADNSSKYDLVIIETWFLQETFLAFGHKYNAPVINFAARFLQPLTAHLIGNDFPVSYIPVTSAAITDHMNFIERVLNSFLYYWDVILGHLYYLRIQDAQMRKYFQYPGSESLPPLSDMVRNTSLTLMDFNVMGIGYPTPFQRNVVEIGGINIDQENEKLPVELQQLMDNAKDGVIYFSFGSYLQLSLNKENVQQSIVSALGKVKQKVLMKLEANSPYKNLTKSNIFIREWFPQPSILAHPNCKLFITHGGLHSILESIYHKVPMIVIPLFADQHFNGKAVETFGIGHALEPAVITEKVLLDAIHEVLNNPSYQKNIEIKSAILKDRPMNILDNAIFWIEYVIRHKGAPHLRPAALDLPWYQYFTIDVIIFYLLIIIVTLYVIVKLFKI